MVNSGTAEITNRRKDFVSRFLLLWRCKTSSVFRSYTRSIPVSAHCNVVAEQRNDQSNRKTIQLEYTRFWLENLKCGKLKLTKVLKRGLNC